MVPRSTQDSSIPPPPSNAGARVDILNTVLTHLEKPGINLARMQTVAETMAQQSSKRALYTITSYRIAMTASDVTIEDVLTRKNVHVTMPARVSRVVNPFPSAPIPKGVLLIGIATFFRAIPTSEILTDLEAHNMELATPLHLGALINSGASLIEDRPITAFSTISRGRRFLRTHLLPYSIRRSEKGELILEVHKPDFWMKSPKDDSLPPPFQLLLVPKTA